MQSPVPCPLPTPLADPRGGALRTRPPSWSNVFHFHADLCKITQNNRFAAHLYPFLGNPGFATVRLYASYKGDSSRRRSLGYFMPFVPFLMLDNSGLYLRRVEVTVGDPVCVALAGHDDVSSWNRPHLPRVIVRRGRKDLLARVQCDSERKIIVGL